jgi:hypothetical protein
MPTVFSVALIKKLNIIIALLYYYETSHVKVLAQE